MTGPLVSICCLAYNHEPYIRDCLEGILMQKTDFPFEVLIHDDASTDRTADIIREYAEKYPDVIKPICQTENQYSKHVRVDIVYNYRRAQGKYIALCEGDDYWTDPGKLQVQFDFMESHPDYSMYCHNVILSDYATGKKRRKFFCKPDQDLRLKDVIRRNGGFIPTQSIFFRTGYLPDIEKYSGNCPVGDYPLQIALAARGRVFYDHRVMAVYRTNTAGSWTTNLRDSTVFITHVKRMHDWFGYLLSLDENLPEHEIRFLMGKFKLMELWPSSDFSVIREDPECRYYMRHAHPVIRFYLLAQIYGWLKKRPFLHL